MEQVYYESHDEIIHPPKEIECLDLAFLFSDPLMQRINSSDNLIPMEDRLDVETEFREIFKHI